MSPELAEAPVHKFAQNIPRLLYNIYLLLSGKHPGVTSGGLLVTFTPPPPTQRTTTTTVATGNGSVAAGSFSVHFGLSSDFVGTIDGADASPSNFASLPYVAPQGDTLEAISYTISAGSLLIIRIS